jgi:hypothetical protein
MRLAVFALLGSVSFLTTSSAFAQPARGGSGGALHAGAGFSGVRLPGNRPIASRPIPPPAPHPQHSSAVIVPYPVYYGGNYYAGYYYGGSSYAQQPAPASDYGYVDGSQGQPSLAIVNQGYSNQGYSNQGYSNQGYIPDTANPVMRDYSNADLPDPGPDYRPQYQDRDQPTIYLLAMSDHTIIPAIAYWADGDTLNYITTEGSQNRVSLSLIDRDFSWKLNDSRGVEFKLPPAK